MGKLGKVVRIPAWITVPRIGVYIGRLLQRFMEVGPCTQEHKNPEGGDEQNFVKR